jgi:hypothetical protein
VPAFLYARANCIGWKSSRKEPICLIEFDTEDDIRGPPAVLFEAPQFGFPSGHGLTDGVAGITPPS